MKRELFFKRFVYQRSIISYILLIILLLFLCQSCKQEKQSLQFTNKDISHVITKMTNIMLHDITNPPLAARFFSYACLAGYEVVSQNDAKFKSMHGILNSYPEIKKPDSIQR